MEACGDFPPLPSTPCSYMFKFVHGGVDAPPPSKPLYSSQSFCFHPVEDLCSSCCQEWFFPPSPACFLSPGWGCSSESPILLQIVTENIHRPLFSILSSQSLFAPCTGWAFILVKWLQSKFLPSSFAGWLGPELGSRLQCRMYLALQSRCSALLSTMLCLPCRGWLELAFLALLARRGKKESRWVAFLQ